MGKTKIRTAFDAMVIQLAECDAGSEQQANVVSECLTECLDAMGDECMVANEREARAIEAGDARANDLAQALQVERDLVERFHVALRRIQLVTAPDMSDATDPEASKAPEMPSPTAGCKLPRSGATGC